MHLPLSAQGNSIIDFTGRTIAVVPDCKDVDTIIQYVNQNGKIRTQLDQFKDELDTLIAEQFEALTNL